jgi:hypothetical protein
MGTGVLESIRERDERDFVFGSGKGGYSGWSKANEQMDQA